MVGRPVGAPGRGVHERWGQCQLTLAVSTRASDLASLGLSVLSVTGSDGLHSSCYLQLFICSLPQSSLPQLSSTR